MTKRTFLKTGNSWVRGVSFALVAGLVLTSAGSGVAQEQNVPQDTSFNIQLFKPSPGPLNFFAIESPELGEDMKPFVGVMMMYERRPFTIYNCSSDNECNDEQEADLYDGSAIGPIHAIDNLLTMDIMGAFNFLKYFQAGLVLPLTAFQNGEGFSVVYDNGERRNILRHGDDYSTVFSPGDLRIHVKGRFLGDDRKDGISLAASAYMSLPLWEWIGYGREESDTNSYGYGGDSFISGMAPRLIFGYRIGKFRTAVNVGMYWRKKVKIFNAEVGHLLEFGGAAGYSIIPEVELLAELYGNKTINSENFTDTESSSLMFLAGGQFRIKDFTIHAAGGGGILSGLGVPQFQFMVGMGWAPSEKEKVLTGDSTDIDMDGIDNERDACPEEPEDMDEFEDDDGCPDPDNDKDGILDGYDSCVNEPEDKDGFNDDDGCPDLDHDEDGIPEPKDKCPNKAEDFDEFEDDDGCPEDDNDKDGILDPDDFCPNDPEDKDGFEDDDGCSEVDNDGDGVPDVSDKCPDQPETLNGVKDDDGCPDKGKTLVVITEKQLELKEMIQFKKNSDQIRGDQSFEILNIVTGILRGNPKLRISIEGHTDNKGSAAYNRQLSKKRADAVRRYLVDKGIAEDRLQTAGWGPDKPIESNKTRKGRAANRRVEFNIIQPEEKEASAGGQAAAGEGGDAAAGDAGGDSMDFTSE
jgi:OmpA-OmpF porin, OOP family